MLVDPPDLFQSGDATQDVEAAKNALWHFVWFAGRSEGSDYPEHPIVRKPRWWWIFFVFVNEIFKRLSLLLHGDFRKEFDLVRRRVQFSGKLKPVHEETFCTFLKVEITCRKNVHSAKSIENAE